MVEVHESEELHGSITDFACIRGVRMKNERIGRTSGKSCTKFLIFCFFFFWVKLLGVCWNKISDKDVILLILSIILDRRC